MSKATLWSIGLVIIYVVLFIAQLWFDVFEGEIFFKITITFGVLFMTTIIILSIKYYIDGEKKLKDDNFID